MAGVEEGASRAADPPGKVRGGPAAVPRGQRGFVIAGGEEIAVAVLTGGGEPGRGMRRRWGFGRGAVGEIGCRGGPAWAFKEAGRRSRRGAAG